MIREDHEMVSFQHVAEVFHGFVYSQQNAIVSAVFLLCWVELLGEESEGLPTRCCSTAPMAEIEASVTSARGTEGSGCANNVACDRLALHASKAFWSSGVQLKGCEPLTQGPERMSWSGA
jgi:hypothetical protein